jgi:hypothetical protein
MLDPTAKVIQHQMRREELCNVKWKEVAKRGCGLFQGDL